MSLRDGVPAVPAAPPQKWLKFYDPDVPAHLDYPHIPIYRLLDDTAARYPHKVCARFFGKPFTYGQIRDLSDRCAAGFRRLGIHRGDRIALLLPNSPQYLIAYYGALKAGAVVVPLNPLYTEHELAFHLSDSAAAMVVTVPLFLSKVLAVQGKTAVTRVICSRLADYLPFPLNLGQGLQEARLKPRVPRDTGTNGNAVIDFQRLLQPPPPDFSPEPVDVMDLAILTYTGGTTGTAKGIMLSHFACVANASQAVAWGHIDDEQRIMAVLPLFHGFGMSVTMNAPVLAGGEIILIPRFKAADVARAIQKYRPDFFIGVPTMFVAFSSLPDIERYDLSSVRGIFVGAAPLTRAIKDSFESRTHGRMIEGYGLTEAVTAVMANPYKGQHKIGSIGIPFPDMDVKIVSLDDGHELPPGEQGEIVLRGPTLMLGYYKSPEETARTLVDGWLHTGDIGYMDEDGYFYITDRKKDLIIVGGFNVFPREIDELIFKHPKVKEGIAIGIPDPYKGERIKAFIVLKDGEKATADEMIAYFKEHLVWYKAPTEIEFRADLPKTMLGKILRRALREETVGHKPPAEASTR